jgi:uracil-DNA glycosylase family 4
VRTGPGRPFTGDFAGDLLYATLLELGFARGSYAARPDDKLALVDCMITNAVRCVPPENKPTSAEIGTCRPFLARRITAMPRLAACWRWDGSPTTARLRRWRRAGRLSPLHMARATKCGPA